MAEALLKNTFVKISPAWELVADVTVDTATTQVDFSDLSFGKEDDLLLVSDFKSPTSNPYIFFNDNATPTNYYTQRLEANNTAYNPNRYNTPYLGVVDVDQFALINTNIKLTNNGYVVYQTHENRSYDATTMTMQIIYGTSTFTATSITKISINAGTNGIAVGSRFQLYKLVAKKVADITISTATTQVDITGLDIDKESEYMLVATRVVGATLVDNGDLTLFVNDNTTHTNYYYQQLAAVNTDLSAERTNKNRWLRGNLGSHFNITKIKLTNNGYFVSQEDEITNLSSSISLIKRYMNSTFTLTSITKLSIIAQEANGIGIGSRFQLYKLK